MQELREVLERIRQKREVWLAAEAAERGMRLEDLKAELEAEEERENQAARAKVREQRLAASLPLRFRTMTFESFEVVSPSHRRAHRRCAEWADNYARWRRNASKDERPASMGLVLSGATGVGKTHLAAAIVHRLIESDLPAQFMNLVSFLSELRASFDGTFRPAITDAKASAAAVLVVDDLGAERGTAWSMETVYQILDHRIQHCLPTILTTNLSVEELQHSVDRPDATELGVWTSRVYGRVLEFCNGEVTVLKADNRRGRKR